MMWVHIVWTIALLATFIVIVVWAWSGKQKERFSDAAQIPLEDEFTKEQHSVDR